MTYYEFPEVSGAWERLLKSGVEVVNVQSYQTPDETSQHVYRETRPVAGDRLDLESESLQCHPTSSEVRDG